MKPTARSAWFSPVVLALLLGCPTPLATHDGASGGNGQHTAGNVAGNDNASTDASGDAGATGDTSSGDAAGADSGENSSGDLADLRVFPPDNPWNTDISAYPVHVNSDAYIASIGFDVGLHPDFGTVWEGAPIGIPYNIVTPETPWSDVAFDYADESDPGPYPIPLSPLIEGGPDSDGDRHILMVDVAGKKLYELFYAFRGNAGWTAGSGAIFDLTSNDLRPAGWTSADAAGLPIFPGLVRYDEVVERGRINHALRFTVSRTQRAYIPPATHFASSRTDQNLPPMGLRVRLRADFDISGFTPNVQVILRAMKQYGMFVADNGSNWYVSGAPDDRWNDDELRQLRDVKGRNFEAVDTGNIVTD